MGEEHKANMNVRKIWSKVGNEDNRHSQEEKEAVPFLVIRRRHMHHKGSFAGGTCNYYKLNPYQLWK